MPKTNSILLSSSPPGKLCESFVDGKVGSTSNIPIQNFVIHVTTTLHDFDFNNSKLNVESIFIHTRCHIKVADDPRQRFPRPSIALCVCAIRGDTLLKLEVHEIDKPFAELEQQG